MSSSIAEILDVLLPQETQTVDFTTFCVSSDFCGFTSLYEFWKDECGALPDNWAELILDGSLGAGKTSVALLEIAYRIYLLFSKGVNMRPYLGMSDDAPIYVLYFSVSLTQAKRSGFNQLKGIIDNCKWFRDNYPRDPNIESEIKFPNNFSIVYASGELHQISLNVVGFILDEANFRRGVGLGMAEEYDSVTSLYSQLIDRQASRFSSKEGPKSFAILISSASYQSSFVEKRKQQIKDNPYAFNIRSVAYKVKPWLFSDDMFEVFIGTDKLSPVIIESPEHKQVLLKQLGIPEEMSSDYFVEVPENLRDAFKSNLLMALQNHAGVPTQIQGKLIANLDILRNAYYTNEHPWFSVDSVVLSNRDEIQLIDYVLKNNIECRTHPHYFFIDLSVGHDTGGFSCVRDDSSLVQDGKKHLTHVFTVGIEPPAYPAMTQISKIEQFMSDISTLVTVAGFASDQYQSTELRQNIQLSLGLDDVRISVDSSDQIYFTVFDLLINGNLKMLYYEKLQREFTEAVHDVKRRRVIKAKGSTDDIMQSFIGASFLAYTTDVEVLLPPRRNYIGNKSIERAARSLGFK